MTTPQQEQSRVAARLFHFPASCGGAIMTEWRWNFGTTDTVR